MSAAAELAHWIRLLDTPGVGVDTARKLLSAFGLPANIFVQEHAALCAVVAPRVAAALLAAPTPATLAQIARTLDWAAGAGNHVLTLADAGYPPQLLEIADPPVLLYAKGRIDLLCQAAIAVVGSRDATAQGLANADLFSAALTAAGLTVVSGLALGVDTAAHQGSLRMAAEVAGACGMTMDDRHACTVAVIGTGVDVVYPARNRALAHATARWRMRSPLPAASSANTGSVRRQSLRIFRGEIASSAACRAAFWWSRRRRARARSLLPAWRSNRGATSLPYRARSTRRWLGAVIS